MFKMILRSQFTADLSDEPKKYEVSTSVHADIRYHIYNYKTYVKFSGGMKDCIKYHNHLAA